MRIRRQGGSLVVDAPAKLNLFLEVLGRRPDGYHELETVMVSIGWFDTLRFTPVQESATVSLSIRSALPGAGEIPRTGENLVLRAAERLREAIRPQRGVAIELFKRIPWQAGLGGGSSNAAATLVALNAMWGAPLPASELHRLAAELGSDVNFFLDSHPLAVCRGRGERLEPVPLRRALDFVVIHPAGGLRTADVFHRWRPTDRHRESGELTRALCGRSGPCERLPLYNALERPAEELHPGVTECLRSLRACGLQHVGMSGSGSGCFGIAASRRQACLAARLLTARTGRLARIVRTAV